MPRWRATARSAKGFMPDEEGMALYAAASVAAASGLGAIVEIGTYCAKSALYLAAGAGQAAVGSRGAGTESGSAGTESGGAGTESGSAGNGRCLVFTVDHHRGSEELGPGWPHHDPEVVDAVTGRTDTLAWARRTVVEAGLEDAIVLVVGESTAVARWWASPLALLFIDGGHAEALAWADYWAWAPQVAAGGALAIHDVFADPAQGGQAPYHLYCQAIESGAFVEQSHFGSLRLLARTEQPWEGR